MITMAAATTAASATRVKKASPIIGRPPATTGPDRSSAGRLDPALGRPRVGHEQHLLRVDEGGPVVVGQLVVVPEHDRLGRADLLAVAAEDAADHVDLVALRVALARRDASLVGVLVRLD